MTITLDAQTQKLLEERMREGGYASENDALRAGLELLAREEIPPLDDETLDAIDEAEDEIERGETIDAREALAKLRREYLGPK
jgi:Arc/MetJ-type ribon-helix-helix transcriptional regulator